jgi:hypothetical protein
MRSAGGEGKRWGCRGAHQLTGQGVGRVGAGGAEAAGKLRAGAGALQALQAAHAPGPGQPAVAGRHGVLQPSLAPTSQFMAAAPCAACVIRHFIVCGAASPPAPEAAAHAAALRAPCHAPGRLRIACCVSRGTGSACLAHAHVGRWRGAPLQVDLKAEDIIVATTAINFSLGARCSRSRGCVGGVGGGGGQV